MSITMFRLSLVRILIPPLCIYIAAPALVTSHLVTDAVQPHLIPGNTASANSFNVVELLPEDVPGAIINKDPENCNMMELQRWLECRRLNQTGLKAVLVQRVKDGLTRDNIPIDPKVNKGVPF